MYKLFGWVVALAMGTLLSGPAPAVTLTFNGPSIDGTRIGVAEADALASGLQIFMPGFVGDADPVLQLFSQNLDEGSIDPFPPEDPPHTATSAWRMENASEFDLSGTVFLMFVTVDPFEAGRQTVDYLDPLVGLITDPADGWVLVKDTHEGQDLYYPALVLGSMSPGEVTDPFDVNYWVNDELKRIGGTFILPKLRLGMAYSAVPIPEPGTLALLTLGLAGLGAVGRRRR